MLVEDFLFILFTLCVYVFYVYRNLFHREQKKMTSEVLAKVWEVLSTHAMSYQTREYLYEREREEVLDTGVWWWLHIIS